MRAGATARGSALAGAAALVALVVAPTVLGVTPSVPAVAQARQAATSAPSPSSAARLAVGGQQLAGTGVVVNYPARGIKHLPKVPASAYVIADARCWRPRTRTASSRPRAR
jgi:hypothetical protein